MNILVIDCGATSSNYHIINKHGESESYTLEGFSPVANLWSSFPVFSVRTSIDKVYFYGTAMKGEFLGQAQNVLKEQFPNSKIQVSSDLHAAALSTAGDESAYIHIIGTGSSTCMIENGEISFPIINMGYLWEDFASGYDIAKTIIHKWMNQLLTKEETDTLNDILGTPESFISKVYKSPSPKAYLAKYSIILDKLLEETQLNIKNERLELYFNKNIDNFADSKKHHFIGSMSVLLEKEIRQKLKERSLKAGIFVKNTNSGLLAYHKNKITNQHE